MKVFFVSLGCDKNLVDTEVMLGVLHAHGYTFCDDESEADVIVINTCCFIHDACEESINTILEMAAYKESGSCKALIVAGCLGTRYASRMHEELPEVDAILSVTAYDRIAEIIENVLNGRKQDIIADPDAMPLPETKRILTGGGHYAYMKIAEGCNKRCTYCIIPSMRGAYRSVPMDRLIKEAEDLAEKGVSELILVAQETTLYGTDLYGYKALPNLLRRLCEIEGLSWIRLLYCYPEEIDEALIEVIRDEKKICHYIDMPIQHASDDILRRMGRKTTRSDLENLIRKLRRKIPDICIRTTLITGFPGETEADHEMVLDFVERMRFDRLGVFTYSREEGTAAFDFDGQVDEETAAKRRDEIMQLQQGISRGKGQEMIGRRLQAFVEGRMVDEDALVARTYRDAPDVDGYVFLQTEREFMSGTLVDVVITGANEYDLTGECLDESPQ